MPVYCIFAVEAHINVSHENHAYSKNTEKFVTKEVKYVILNCESKVLIAAEGLIYL